MSDAPQSETVEAAPAQAAPPPKELDKKQFRWRPALVAAGALLLICVIVPRCFHAWHTVSTDDAYVNSYVTFVAPRVIGQVARVLVDDNNRVTKGQVLVELDSEPYRVQVAIKQAAVDAARAEIVVTEAACAARSDRRAVFASSSSTRSRTWTIRWRCYGRVRPRLNRARPR
jgi:membrane fusion protein (multidrug efflux system)